MAEITEADFRRELSFRLPITDQSTIDFLVEVLFPPVFEPVPGQLVAAWLNDPSFIEYLIFIKRTGVRYQCRGLGEKTVIRNHVRALTPTELGGV